MIMLTYQNDTIFITFHQLKLATKGDCIQTASGEKIFLPVIRQQDNIWHCGNKDITIEHRLKAEGEGHFSVSTILRNHCPSGIPIGQIFLFDAMQAETSFACERAFVSSQSILGPEGIQPFTDNVFSWSLLGMTTVNGLSSCLFGFSDFSHEFYHFSANKTNAGFTVNSVCERDGVILNGELQIADLVVFQMPGLSQSLNQYADILSENMNVKLDKEKMTGWCSWYHYYSRETQQDIIENIAALKQSSIADKVKVIQIDDGWNLPENDSPKVWGDWNPGAKFHYDMKEMSDDIHKSGYLSGLWLAPFSVSKDSQLFHQHPDWVLGLDDGILKMEDYGLDLSNPQVLEFIRTTFNRVFEEWKFDYIKIDFLLHATMHAKKRFDPSITSAEAYRKGLQVIRECAKDKFVLCCGAPVYQSIGLCDGMRIGPDVGARWYLPLNLGGWPKGNCAIKPAMYTALSRHWMHGRLWQNDPDCAVVRSCATEHEKLMFGNEFGGTPITEKDFGLTFKEADCWSKCLWLLNEMVLLSENYASLPDERKQLIDRCFDPYFRSVSMVDFYECDEFITMQNDEIIGIFNLSDKPQQLKLPMCTVLATQFKEIFGASDFICEDATVSFPVSQPRTTQIYQKIKEG